MTILFLFLSCAKKKETYLPDVKTAEIILSGNPTTGYTWIYETSGHDCIELEEFITYLGDDGKTGAPSQFKYVLKGKKEGSEKIHFEYKRPWENSEPLEIKNYSISVNKNLEISVTEIKS